MKKIFTLFAAMLFALTASATSTTLGSDNPKDTHANAISAVVSSYDTIFLKAGIYTESGRIAVSGATKVIKAINDTVILKATKDYQVTNGAKVTYDGIFFDGSTIGSNRGFTTADASVGNEYRFNNCEFYSFPKYVITTNSESCSIDSVIVTGCYFHNNTRGPIYFPASNVDNQETCYGLIVKNSTFANNDASGDWTSIIDFESKGAALAENVQLLVDHCTFYNNLTKNSDHASVRSNQAKTTKVSNCIFAHPERYERRATYLIANPSYAQNCITFNLKSDSANVGHTWMTQRTNCFFADPLFVDAAKGNFSLKGDYTTGEVSPARGAATDGTDLGDPRWYTPGKYTETDFSGDGYFCAAADASLTGSDDKFCIVTPEAPAQPYILYNNKDAYGAASWSITALQAALVEVTLNLGSYDSHKHIFEIQVLRERGGVVDTIAEGPAYTGDGYADYNTNKVLSGYLYIPEAGNYTIRLLNNRKWSKMAIYGVTLKYIDAPMPMYLTFASGITWETAGAKFSAYSFEDGKTAYFSKFMKLAENETNIYTAIVPANYAKIIFVRHNSSAVEPSFDNRWNQTSDQTRTSGKDFFLINGGQDNDYTGVWKKYCPNLENGYYLVGVFGGVGAWDEEDLTASKKFAANPDVDGEYIVEANLSVDDRIKAVSINGRLIEYWYPNVGDGWVIDTNHAAADKKVYLRPNGGGGEGWLNTVLYVPENGAPTAIDNTVVGEKAVKLMENGQIVIIKNGVRYNVLGTVIK